MDIHNNRKFIQKRLEKLINLVTKKLALLQKPKTQKPQMNCWLANHIELKSQALQHLTAFSLPNDFLLFLAQRTSEATLSNYMLECARSFNTLLDAPEPVLGYKSFAICVFKIIMLHVV